MASHDRLVYLTTAPDQITAEMWRELLRGEDVTVIIRFGDTASYLGVTGAPCRMLVSEDRLEEARRVLEDQLGPDALV
ncbi:MAG: DUF2007 domain-containing protein [Chloroflexi bacterium]|nr:DUF2007 domain-containing protein [Chloroflexota bacterium]